MAKPGFFDQPDFNRTLALEVEGCKFWVSRETLATCSPVFKAMLYGEFAESKKDTIELPGKRARHVEEFVQCLFPCPRLKDVDESNFEVLLALADEWQVDVISPKVEQFLMRKVKSLPEADEKLLELLRNCSKLKMKEVVAELVKRCGREFFVDELKLCFPYLPGEVVAALMLYEYDSPLPYEGCRYELSADPAFFFRKRIRKCEFCDTRLKDRSCDVRCSLCGSRLCGQCLSKGKADGKICGGTTGRYERQIQDLLNRL